MKRILYIGGFELPDKNAAAHRVLAIAKGCETAVMKWFSWEFRKITERLTY